MHPTAKITSTGNSGYSASGLWLRRMSRIDQTSDMRVHTRVSAELTLHPISKGRAQAENMLSRKSVDVRRVA